MFGLFAFLACFVQPKATQCGIFYTQIPRANLAQRATTIRHQPTVHCAPFNMAAMGVSKRLKGPTLEGDKKINSPGKAVFLF